MEALEIQQFSSQQQTNGTWPMGAGESALVDERDFFWDDNDVIGNFEPVMTGVQKTEKRGVLSFANVGRFSLLALVTIMAFEGGFVWERYRLLPDSTNVKQQGLQSSMSEGGTDMGGATTNTMTKTALDPAIFFTVSLSWLPESSSGLRFSIPSAKMETVDVVQELMAINMRGDEIGQVLSPIKPSGQHSRPYDPLWSDLDPEMLQIVAQISFPEGLARETGEKTISTIDKDPFSQEELVDLVAVR